MRSVLYYKASRVARSIICLGLLTQPCTVAAASTILLESHFEGRPQDATFYLEFLTRTLGANAPVTGVSLREAIEVHLSSAAGPPTALVGVRGIVEEGRRQFIEGEFTRAIAQLEEAKSFLMRHTAALAADQTLRDLMHKALLYLAHAYLRTRQEDLALQLIQEAIRSYPERELSLARYGPELALLYRETKKKLGSAGLGSLIISTQPRECLVFLNERYVGMSPVRLRGLYPGRYRIYLQRPGAQGRVHSAQVSAGEHRQLSFNFLLDHVLRSDPFVGFSFASQREKVDHEIPLALMVATALSADKIMLFEFDRFQGRRVLRGRLILAPSGRTARAALVFLDPKPPEPTALKGLGQILALGKDRIVKGVLVLKQMPLPESISGDHAPGESRKFFSTRVWRWVMLGTGAVGLGAGIPLLSLHGQGTCDNAAGVRCQQNYNTLVPGIIFTSVGALSAGASALFFYYAARQGTSVRSTFFLPWGAPGGGGLVGVVSF